MGKFLEFFPRKGVSGPLKILDIVDSWSVGQHANYLVAPGRTLGGILAQILGLPLDGQIRAGSL